MISDKVPIAAVRSPTERSFFCSNLSVFRRPENEWMTHVIFHDERVKGLEGLGKCSTQSGGESRDEIPSGSDEHRIIFRGLFGRFFVLVLVRILLADGLLLEDSGGQ